MSQQEQAETWRLLPPEEVERREAGKEAALRAAQVTPGARTQHARLSIDFHITIAGTPPDDEILIEPDPAYHARQALLLAAVRSNPAVLQQWMSGLIVNQMGQKGWAYWDQLTGGEMAFQDMFASALAALQEDDQAYFAEVATGESFEDL
ncbi:MAG TPA: hypothetical protein VJ761_18445, partial [Ktedonobacteraceae bacterium]|nr:hypothetical protein [Ktedonobacteraceae bacterium]